MKAPIMFLVMVASGTLPGSAPCAYALLSPDALVKALGVSYRCYANSYYFHVCFIWFMFYVCLPFDFNLGDGLFNSFVHSLKPLFNKNKVNISCLRILYLLVSHHL